MPRTGNSLQGTREAGWELWQLQKRAWGFGDCHGISRSVERLCKGPVVPRAFCRTFWALFLLQSSDTYLLQTYDVPAPPCAGRSGGQWWGQLPASGSGRVLRERL